MSEFESTAAPRVTPIAELPLRQRLRRVFGGYFGTFLLLAGVQLGVARWRAHDSPSGAAFGWATVLAAELLAVALGAVLFAVCVRLTHSRLGRMLTGAMSVLPLAAYFGLRSYSLASRSGEIGAGPAAVLLLVAGAVIGLAVLDPATRPTSSHG